jgi:hypothetical protein
MPINSFFHLKLRRLLSAGSFFTRTPPIHLVNGQSSRRLRYSVERSPVNHGSVAFFYNIQRLNSEDHLALIPSVHRLSTNPLSTNTLIGFSNSFENIASPLRTYITWMRRGVREVAGTKGQDRNILYLADDGRSTCCIVQILSSSQSLNVSVQMVHPYSQDLSSWAMSSAWNGLQLTPKSGEFQVYHSFRLGIGY